MGVSYPFYPDALEVENYLLAWRILSPRLRN